MWRLIQSLLYGLALNKGEDTGADGRAALAEGATICVSCGAVARQKCIFARHILLGQIPTCADLEAEIRGKKLALLLDELHAGGTAGTAGAPLHQRNIGVLILEGYRIRRAEGLGVLPEVCGLHLDFVHGGGAAALLHQMQILGHLRLQTHQGHGSVPAKRDTAEAGCKLCTGDCP